jgi:hypothetical protein
MDIVAIQPVDRSELFTVPEAKAKANIIIPQDDEGRRALLVEYGYDPVTHVLYSNGAVYNKEKGRGGICGHIGNGPINRSNAKQYREMQSEVRIRAMETALEREVKAGHLEGNLIEINRAVIRTALDKGGIAQMKATEMIYRLLGMIGEEADTQKAGVNLTMDAESIEALRDIIVTLRGT